MMSLELPGPLHQIVLDPVCIVTEDHVTGLLPPHDTVVSSDLALYCCQVSPRTAHKDPEIRYRKNPVYLVREILTTPN